MEMAFAGQPSSGTIATKIAQLAGSSEYTQLDVAVAYATIGGVLALVRAMPPEFDGLKKRWLIGVDWCRSEPDAMNLLAGLNKSEVRIHDGAAIVARKGCYPTLPYHPKGFMFSGDSSRALAFGSANLSRNGLTQGNEADLIVLASQPPKWSTEAWAEAAAATAWFEQLWNKGSALATVDAPYRKQFANASNLRQPPRTDDDTAESTRVGRPHSFSANDLVQLRACRYFWVEAGKLHKNRGPMLPGNQLMLRALSRVYFGFPARDVPRDTFMGYVNLVFAGSSHPDRSLRFSNNSMDVLALPVPGTGSQAGYDGETLHFERMAQRGGLFLRAHAWYGKRQCTLATR